MNATYSTWPPPDPLGEALHVLRVDGAFYSRADLSEPWGIELDPIPEHLWFHLVTHGRALLEVEGEPPLHLQPGDCALVPHGRGHTLRSDRGAHATAIADLPLEHLTDRYELFRHGGGGAPTTLICGAIRLAHPVARRLTELLPRVLLLEATDDVRAGTLRDTIRLMAAEARSFRPGGEAIITRLADILVIQAIRAWIETAPDARLGWLGALQDPQIGRALALIHRDPAQPWTVERLAGELGMSRSSFAARFTALVGEPAMQYVTRWRVHLAQHTLETEQATVGELAHRFGYRSEAAFARAFKRVTGIAPGAVRRAAAQQPQIVPV